MYHSITNTLTGIIVAAGLFSASAALAHEDFIVPNQFVFTANEKEHSPFTLAFDITASDMYFNADRNRFKDDPAFVFSITGPDGKALAPSFLQQGKTKAFGEVTLAEKGTYLLTLRRADKPAYYSELTRKEGDGVEYIALPKRLLTEEQQARVVKTKAYLHNIKTFVTVEQPSDSWKTPVGHIKEIMPLAHPNTVNQAEGLPVQVFFQGKPFAGATVRALYEGYQPPKYGDAPVTLTADDKGIVTVPFDRPGRWLIESNHTAKTPEDTDAPNTKYAATLMLEVK